MRLKLAFLLILATAPYPKGLVQAQSAAGKPAALKTPITYRNTQYGFCFLLPASWKGFSILTDQWTGEVPNSSQRLNGPAITIRHPKWTEYLPYQDIPIMIFTPEIWEKVDHDEIFVSAAPYGPSEIARNSRYVFALPPRYSISGNPRWEEVEQLIAQQSLQAPCGHRSKRPSE